jgi:hypothetical protein
LIETVRCVGGGGVVVVVVVVVVGAGWAMEETILFSQSFSVTGRCCDELFEEMGEVD